MRKSALVFLVALLTTLYTAPLFANECQDAVRKKESLRIQKAETIRNRLAKIYSQNSEKENPFMFGFESEYTLNSYSSKLLDYYGPRSDMGLSPAQWTLLKPNDPKAVDGRVEWIKKNLDLLFESKKAQGKIVLLNPTIAPAYLPNELILDYTGNLEIILQPATRFSEWKERVDWINKNLGTGSMQSTLGIPKKMLFDVTDKTAALRANVGYFQFMADFDSLLKLMQGYEKYLEEPGKPAASAFQHPFLGPLTALKREYLTRIFSDNLQGKSWDRETLDRIGFNDDSFKYIGSTSYRPDLGGKDFVVLEVRDAHSNYPVLYEKLTRAMYYFSNSRDGFAAVFDVKAFDSVAGFEALPKRVQAMLIKLFPQKPLEEGDQYGDAEIIANQVYRNFAFPMRDWSLYLKIMGQSDKFSRVQSAQTRYLNALLSIESQISKREIDDKTANLRVQGAVAQFAVDSEMVMMMLEWLESLTLRMQLLSSYLFGNTFFKQSA